MDTEQRVLQIEIITFARRLQDTITLLDSSGLDVFIKIPYREEMKCVLMCFQMMVQMGNMLYMRKELLVKAGNKHGIQKEVLMVLIQTIQTYLQVTLHITIWTVASGVPVCGGVTITDVE